MAQDQVIFVTGGAGYIGSHVVHALHDAGISAVVLDDLSTGRADLLPAGVPLIEGDIGDSDLVARICAEHDVTAVMHFAGKIVVPESVERPFHYYRENTVKARALIDAVAGAGVDKFIYSSTAAVYGENHRAPVSEESPVAPSNPYGSSKLMVEWMLEEAAVSHGLRFAALRYFNVAGADPRGRTGQATPKATHLIKTMCEVVTGKRAELVIFGDDYDTDDGTCVRDYIHVSDLAAAHLAALDHLISGGKCMVLNCGYGRGSSVRQVLDAFQAASGKELPVRIGPRRAGDAAFLVADVGKLLDTLEWSPQHQDLSTMVSSALAWEDRLGRD